MRLAPILALLPLPALAAVEQGPPNAPYQPAFENQTRAPELPDTPVQATPSPVPSKAPGASPRCRTAASWSRSGPAGCASSAPTGRSPSPSPASPR